MVIYGKIAQNAAENGTILSERRIFCTGLGFIPYAQCRMPAEQKKFQTVGCLIQILWYN